MVCCTFAGHREILLEGIEEKLRATIEEVLKKDTEICFYIGGMGEFDRMCEHMVRKCKSEHPDKRIFLVLVEPYMKQSINTNGFLLMKQYDEIIIPTEWAGCHYKQAITYRNRWMVDHSQYLIACVYRKNGGAYTTLKYAIKKGIQIENLYECKTGPRVDAGREMV